MSGKSSASSSPTSSNSSPGKVEFVVGNRIEAMDYLSNWYVSKIAKVDHKKKKILIHFEGWNSRYDEWVSFESKKIRPLPKEKIKSKSKVKEYKEWKEGDLVSAKWSDGSYYPAKIVKVVSKELYEVEYDDGFQKAIHQSKIREKDTAAKKPLSSVTSFQPSRRKAKLAEDRACRAFRRSVKDKSLLSPTTSEPTEQMEGKKEQGLDKKADQKSQDKIESSHKRQRHDSETLQESKCPKIELSTTNETKSCDLESTSIPSTETMKATNKTEESVPSLSKPNESKTPETVELQSEETSRTSPKMKEHLKTSSPDSTSLTENTIRVTHIKESPKNHSSKTENSKRSVTSPLSVEVEPRTDIRQVIIPDKDMKILQSTGVLGLLNVQEPCVILGTSLAGSTTTSSAAEEILSKCNIPANITTEVSHAKVTDVKLHLCKDKIGQKNEEVRPIEKEEILNKKQDPNDIKLAKGRSSGTILDSMGVVDTSKDVKSIQSVSHNESSGVKKDIEGETGKEKDMTGYLEKSEKHPDQTKLVQKQSGKICLEADKNPVKGEGKSVELGDTCALKMETSKEDYIEHAQKSEEGAKNKPQVGTDAFKAKRMRLDQITGKLSIQRQTQITAKREVIKQKLDHLKSEEITKSAQVTPSYQQISPSTVPSYPLVEAPVSRITPQYAERYPAPALLTYNAPTQCTGPCCAYHPASAYCPPNTASYHLSSGGLPRETYVMYGHGCIAPTIGPAPCSCCSLYSPAVLHESGQAGPSLVRLMQVDQCMSSLPASVVYTQTTSLPGPKISPRGLSPRGISPKGISAEGRKPGRPPPPLSKKAEQESGGKHGGKQNRTNNEGKQGIRSEESTPKKLIQTSSRLPRDVKNNATTSTDRPPSDAQTVKHSHTNIQPHTSTKVHPSHPKSTPTNPSSTPTTLDVNLSKHLTSHLTSRDNPTDSTPTKKIPPTRLAFDPDDLPLSRLVGTSTPGDNTPGSKTPREGRANTPGVKTPASTSSDGTPDCELLMSTPLLPESYPGKGLKRPHIFAPKELRIELDHNKFKCEYPDCDKSFRKASLLESHVKYYHSSPPDNKRKRSSASGSEEDPFESGHPKRRTKRQSTSDVSIGSVGDISVEAQSPTASDINVEVEHDVDEEMYVDISEHKEEDVVRCLCGVHEDSGLMIQCEQCYTWQHSDCVNVGEEHVPTKYLCYVCTNPPGLRKNAKYKNNYDWFKTGVLPSFVPREDDEVKIVQAQVTHCLLSDLYSLNSEMKGVKQKIHILRTPNHTDLKMWEHKHEACEDDGSKTEEETSRNESSISDKDLEDNEIFTKEGNLSGGIVEEDSVSKETARGENVPSDGSNTRVETNARGTRETRGNDVTDSTNGRTPGGEEHNQIKSTLNDNITGRVLQKKNEGITGNRKARNSERDRDVHVTEPSGISKQENQLSQVSQDSNQPRDDQGGARNNEKTARLHDNQACNGKNSARTIDAEARGRAEGNDLSNIERNEEYKMKYSGEDLAFVNLLEEIEEDQTFFDEQLDRLEKQVEILEKSFMTGTTERRPSMRKLAKQLSKLQKLGFVC